MRAISFRRTRAKGKGLTSVGVKHHHRLKELDAGFGELGKQGLPIDAALLQITGVSEVLLAEVEQLLNLNFIQFLGVERLHQKPILGVEGLRSGYRNGRSSFLFFFDSEVTRLLLFGLAFLEGEMLSVRIATAQLTRHINYFNILMDCRSFVLYKEQPPSRNERIKNYLSKLITKEEAKTYNFEPPAQEVRPL